MSASINANMFICASIVAGIGIGFVNGIVPPWVSELSQAHNRGANFSLVFVANFFGIIVAYWLNFGIRNSSYKFQWRFPLAFMAIPVLIIALTVLLLLDPPRWLMSTDRREDAIEILAKVRGDLRHDDPVFLAEVEQLEAAIGRHSENLHLGRRVWMGFALQLIQQWTGILAIAT